jgi:transcription initiation factor IIE alpha subunit
MADVPAEAVEFARMAVRAFYPVEYAVVADGVLRRNNFCSHADLAAQLRMRPKELRQILSRMVSARLMCSEKYQQKRINYKDERQPSRIVQTEYWHVPLPQLIDAFQFRVDTIARGLDEQIRLESEQDMYMCQGCEQRYKLVDIVQNVDPATGRFFCDAILLNRRSCNSEIKEEDNSSRLKETESFKKHFEDDLRPLRSLAERCNALKIPVHPLEGADEETWARYVPEMIGVRGEIVNAEGLDAKMVDELNDGGGASEAPGIVIFGPGANGGGDSAVIPDRPSWFKASSKDNDEDDDDWEDNDGAAGAEASQPAFGTGAMFGGGKDTDAKSYLDSYMEALGGDTGENDGDGAVKDSAPKSMSETGLLGSGSAADATRGNDGPAEIRGDVRDSKPSAASEVAVAEPNDEAGEAGQQFVFVKGVKLPLSEITEELAEEMTQEEFQQYCEISNGGDDNDDDDVEFE